MPQKHLGGRVLRFTQAKVLGGGSSINAQIYTRGNARDYDAWVSEAGCEGWAWPLVMSMISAGGEGRSAGLLDSEAAAAVEEEGEAMAVVVIGAAEWLGLVRASLEGRLAGPWTVPAAAAAAGGGEAARFDRPWLP